jgi:hypothetical protein
MLFEIHIFFCSFVTESGAVKSGVEVWFAERRNLLRVRVWVEAHFEHV